MRKVILQEFVSIDGLAAYRSAATARDQNFDCPGSTGEKAFADKLNATRKVVFSTKLDRAPWGDWDELTAAC